MAGFHPFEVILVRNPAAFMPLLGPPRIGLAFKAQSDTFAAVRGSEQLFQAFNQ